MRIISRIVILILGLLLTITAFAQSAPKLRTDMLVSTGWLAEHLHDPNIILVHFARYHLDYARAHIPGARFLPTYKLVTDNFELTYELPPVEDLRKALEAIGVTNQSRIILYGTQSPSMTTRAYFTLDYLGLGDRTSILDGGIEKWKTENRPLSKESPKITLTKLTVHPRPDLVTHFREVRKLAEATQATALLLDARPSSRYKDGHIPGAASLFWVDTLTSHEMPSWKSPDELRRMFEAAGFKPGTKIITYCEIGQFASHAYFTARYLGYDVSLYDGSYDEWTNSEDAPVVRGEARR